LGILARHPDRQGSGVARRLTRIALANASRDGVPAVLETTNPLNVKAYERAGWTVHAVNDELQPAMRIWVMRHDGASAAEPEPEPEPEPEQ
jgi:predicted N-acetyltransferase YhbS